MTQATLGLAVDSSQVEKGTISLDKLTTSAQRAEGAAERLAGGNRQAASSAQQVSGAAEREAAALTRATTAANDNARAITRTGAAMRAANQNFRGGGLSVANLAAQFQDVGVSAAMMSNPLQVALQQGTQISAVLGPLGAAGAAKALGAAFVSVLSPLSLAVIGVTALVTAGLQMVDWAATGQMALYGVAGALEVIGPYAVAAAAAIALLYAPSVVTGLVSLIALLSRTAVAALGMAAAFAAANPAVAFVLGITAAVAALNIFRDEINQAFGFDLVKSIKDWGNYLIDIVARAFNTAVGFVETGVNKIIRALNKLPGTDFEAANLSGFKLPTGGDHIGAFTSAISSGASAAADRLRELADGFIGVGAEADKAAKKAAESYADITRGAEQFIAKQELERDTYLMTSEAAAAMRYEQDLLNKAANDNITLSAAQREQLRGLAQAMASAEAATAAYKAAVDFAKETGRGFFADMRAGLQDGESAWNSFGLAAEKALQKIEDKLFDLATDQLIDGLFSGLATAGVASPGGGGLGSLLTGLFGGARAAGGPVSSGRAYLVGERGPELFVPGASGAIVPNGGGSGPVSITIVNKGTPQDVKSQRTSPGGRPGRDITLELDDMSAKNIRRAGSASNMAVQGLGGRAPIRER
ncbi:phage tail length tape measure family protein [Methyloceanibacter caenitepidi]|uniref:Bacteriophage tail tape measure N-terminal domain-containing protein n=1 Tax=Methyloceanibacter caenitepidi TaxID=1384459 RepID=A0A0A8K717_9HYPH|nr:phage tail length tape measure family protein [Methyloceanibacter caenitepidi]BAQ18302.1 hypothetical protein GL4_2869 [Methyloceanibacter caenitepidi]